MTDKYRTRRSEIIAMRTAVEQDFEHNRRVAEWMFENGYCWPNYTPHPDDTRELKARALFNANCVTFDAFLPDGSVSEETAKPGDWIVRRQNGWGVLSDEQFNDTFVPVSETDPKALQWLGDENKRLEAERDLAIQSRDLYAVERDNWGEAARKSAAEVSRLEEALKTEIGARSEQDDKIEDLDRRLNEQMGQNVSISQTLGAELDRERRTKHDFRDQIQQQSITITDLQGQVRRAKKIIKRLTSLKG